MSESDTILDPFSGSFTTGLAAYKKHIHSVSIEKQSEYVELSKKRLNEIKEKNKFQQTTLPFMDI
jgi:DNA modification methylase